MYEKIEYLLDKFYKTYYKIEEINLNQVIKCLTTSELHIIEAIEKLYFLYLPLQVRLPRCREIGRASCRERV